MTDHYRHPQSKPRYDDGLDGFEAVAIIVAVTLVLSGALIFVAHKFELLPLTAVESLRSAVTVMVSTKGAKP